MACARARVTHVCAIIIERDMADMCSRTRETRLPDKFHADVQYTQASAGRS